MAKECFIERQKLGLSHTLNRVVQVLEAVQLPVKTPLFIAVLAINERYITRALERFYQGVLSKRGRPSGSDYLEEIIQLSYWVRPIMANTLESDLRSQFPSRYLGQCHWRSQIQRIQSPRIQYATRLLPLSPRTLKRLSNVYKLFKIVCRTRGIKPDAISAASDSRSISPLRSLSQPHARHLR